MTATPLRRGVTVTSPRRARHGTLLVWRVELGKLSRLVRVRAALAACLVAPFLVAAAVSVQSSVPSDTLFGQFLHESGYALPMVVLSFAGQWVLPLLTALIAGDIFSAEDHLGTWKMVLTRSRTRREIFAGKVLAALTYSVSALAVLAAASLVAGLLLGSQPVIGLSGQLVPAGQAVRLVAASWATQLPPVLGFCLLAVALSVATRSSVLGMGVPVVLGLLMQLSTLLDLPSAARESLLSTPFGGWHGFWVQPYFAGPFWHGLVTSSVWAVVSLLVAAATFLRRSVRVS
jgi:ABC-2 type transport system permease protein